MPRAENRIDDWRAMACLLFEIRASDLVIPHEVFFGEVLGACGVGGTDGAGPIAFGW